MKKAYSYIRFSSITQGKGSSITRQTQMRDAYLARHPDLALVNEHVDKGVSASKGKHAAEGALSVFLGLVKAGKIDRGSVLIVEAMDRLSRDRVSVALEIFLNLINTGIEIVILEPEKSYTQTNVDKNVMDLQYAIMLMASANEYTKNLGFRSGNNWKQKRDVIAGYKITGKCPAWMKPVFEKVNGRNKVVRFDLIPEKVAIVKRIVEMGVSGLGKHAILRKLNQEKIGVIGNGYGNKAKVWQRSTIDRIIKSRSLIGEFQPHTIAGGIKRKEVGRPIKGYYPAVIDEATFNRLQGVINARKKIVGRKGKYVTNLFGGGLLINGHDLTPMKITYSEDKKMIMRSNGTLLGTSKQPIVQYRPFEIAFIECVNAIQRATFSAGDFNNENPVKAKIDTYEGELSTIAAKRAKIDKLVRSALESGDDVADEINTILGELKARQKDLDILLQNAKAEAATTIASPSEIVEIYNSSLKMNDEEKEGTRERLRAAIHSAIKQIKIWSYRSDNNGQSIYNGVLVEFKNGYSLVFQLRYGRYNVCRWDILMWLEPGFDVCGMGAWFDEHGENAANAPQVAEELANQILRNALFGKAK